MLSAQEAKLLRKTWQTLHEKNYRNCSKHAANVACNPVTVAALACLQRVRFLSTFHCYMLRSAANRHSLVLVCTGFVRWQFLAPAAKQMQGYDVQYSTIFLNSFMRGRVSLRKVEDAVGKIFCGTERRIVAHIASGITV
jgi:hypothetical protein